MGGVAGARNRNSAASNGSGSSSVTGPHDDISRLPLDTKLVPKQLLRAATAPNQGPGSLGAVAQVRALHFSASDNSFICSLSSRAVRPPTPPPSLARPVDGPSTNLPGWLGRRQRSRRPPARKSRTGRPRKHSAPFCW